MRFNDFFSRFSEGRSCHPDLSEGGAFQVSLSQLQVDFYPYHLACGDRSMWIRYSPEHSVHTGWLENSLRQFQTTLLDSVASNKGGHAPLSRSGHPVSFLILIRFRVEIDENDSKLAGNLNFINKNKICVLCFCNLSDVCLHLSAVCLHF